MNGRILPGLLAGLAVALAGCSTTDDAAARPSPSPTEHDAPEPSPSPSEHDLAVDWTGAFDVALPDGWSLRDCEGDRLDVCVGDGEVTLGDVELLQGYPLDEAQVAQEEAVVLTELADGFLEDFRQDRADGCPDFEFVADEVRDVTVGGQPGKRAAFRLLDRDGATVEHVVNHFTLQGGTYAIVNTDAYVAEGGCLGVSEYDLSFAPRDLATFERHLDDLVAGSPLPAAPAP